MHTHDLENHDNLYAEEVQIQSNEPASDARNHAFRAVMALLATLGVLAAVAAMTQGGPLG